jgi:hypothetical protein
MKRAREDDEDAHPLFYRPPPFSGEDHLTFDTANSNSSSLFQQQVTFHSHVSLNPIPLEPTPHIISTLDKSLESFPLLNADEVTQVILFLDLRSIIKLKSSCRSISLLLDSTPQIWKHMFRLALSIVPTISLVPPGRCDEMIECYQQQFNAFAGHQWNKQMSQFNAKLKPFRDIVTQGIELSNIEEEQYQQLIYEMIEAYCQSKIEKKEYSEYGLPGALDFAAVRFYYNDYRRSRTTIQIPVDMIMNYVSDGNDLTTRERDQYITELIEARFGTFSTSC